MSPLDALYGFFYSKLQPRDRYYLLCVSRPTSLKIYDWKSLLTRTSLVGEITLLRDSTLHVTIPWYTMRVTRQRITYLVNEWNKNPLLHVQGQNNTL